MKTRNAEAPDSFSLTKDEQLGLRKCVLVIESFRAIRRIMPLQHVYAFLLVAMEEGCSVSEYARRAGVTQAVMTRILFALGSRSQGRESGYALVQQAIDLGDSRRTQTFLTAKGRALIEEIVRLIRSDHPRPITLSARARNVRRSQPDLAHDQWLSKLISAGRKLDSADVKLAVRQIEALVSYRKSEITG
jgi:DNA-binding MarR family transcriptional regulator